MEMLNFPPISPKIKTVSGTQHIFDEFRRRYVLLTPEEWVRQHLLHYLKSGKGYPGGLLAVETSLKYNRMRKRADVVAWSRTGTPLLIAECKAPTIAVNQEAFNQIARYNMALRVPCLVVTNGLKHYCCRMDYAKGKYRFLNGIPDFNEVNGW